MDPQTPISNNSISQSQIPQQVQPSNKLPLLAILVALLSLGISLFLGYQNFQLKKQIEQQSKENTVPFTYTQESGVTPTMQIIPTAVTTQPTPMTKCDNKTIGVSVSLPDSSWTCKNAEDNYTMNITSSKFSVIISTLGRGPFCTPPDTDPSSPRYEANPDPKACVISQFLKNGVMDVSLYTSNDIDKEIFGTINNGPGLSVSFVDSKFTKFTAEDKTKIKKLLEGITKL